MSEIYVSVDIEADGPIPGRNSMLSLGAAAFLREGKSKDFAMKGTFSANLEELPGSVRDADTMENFWAKNPEAWVACRVDPQNPKTVMHNFKAWVESFGKKPVFVGYPAGFDFTFVYWYMTDLLGPGQSPFAFTALDIKSYAMGVLGGEYRDITKRLMDPFMPKDAPHTHVAVDDAIEQGLLFCNLVKESEKRLDEAWRYRELNK